MQQKHSVNTLLQQVERFYLEFDKHFRLLESLISQLKASSSDGETHELLLYTMELTNDKMKGVHGEIGKHLSRLISRKFRYKYVEEKINGD